MHRRRPFSQRAILLLTGILTILCSGGCGLDSLVAAADDGESTSATRTVTAMSVVTAETSADGESSHSDCGCGCISCHATVPFAFVPGELASLPEAASFAEASVPSETFAAPLVPPPQT